MNVLKLIAIGIFSGLILGGFFKLVENITSKKVYILLMNIDYIPIVKDWQLNEEIEFLLHLIVSVMLVIVLYFFLRKCRLHGKFSAYIFVNVVIGAMLYVTTSFSQRTPGITDGFAFLYWIIGHIVYGTVVGSLIFFTKKE